MAYLAVLLLQENHSELEVYLGKRRLLRFSPTSQQSTFIGCHQSMFISAGLIVRSVERWLWLVEVKFILSKV